MSAPKVLYGFHAVGVRLKTAPASVIEVYFDASRRDARMRQFMARAQEAGVRLIEADGARLAKLAGSLGHQGVAARVHNGGVSGDTTTAGRGRLGWVLTGLKAKPDLVILELGANDMLRGQSPALAKANLDAMIADLKRRKIPVLLAGMKASYNLDRRYRAEFDGIYPLLARKHGVRLYPFFMDGVAGNRALLLPDQMHPNAKGVSVLVQRILPSVKASLKR